MYSFKQYLAEMAMPTEDISSKTFYHGCPSEEKSHSILKQGLQPPNLEDRKGFLKPIDGKVYATHDIGYAQIYALGGDVAGTKTGANFLKKSNGQHGYVFKFSGDKLKHVQPDEDSIGELVGNGKGPGWLHHMARTHIADSTLRRAKDGEYAYQAKIGKVLVKRMSDPQKLELIAKHGAHIAHHGEIIPDEAYRIDRDKTHLLNRDGSNFFEHAERIK